jgi:hypothetical protein
VNILVLEDNGARIEIFVNMFGDNHDLTVCTTANAFRAAYLAQPNLDIVFLDHDLGGSAFSDSESSNCGMRAVEVILEAVTRPRLVVVHSWNGPAGDLMVKRLEERQDIKCCRILFGHFNFRTVQDAMIC